MPVEKGGAHERIQGPSEINAMESWAASDISIQKKSKKLDAKSVEEKMRRKQKKKMKKADDRCKNRRAQEPWMDSSMRRKREMTPSELYFCEICAAKARELWPADDDDVDCSR